MTLTVAEHIAMEGVAPFALEDEVTLPSGARLRGSIARVYSLLRGTVEQNMAHRIGAKVGPAGWVPGYYIRKAWSGGNAGDRRLRDLREKGVDIVHQRFGEGTEEESNTYLYRWVSDPAPGTAIRTPDASRRNPPIGSDLANGRVSTEPAPIRTPPSPHFTPAPGKVSFFTCVGNPGSGAAEPINLAPHFRHCLAPSVRLMADLVRGFAKHQDAKQLYRNELAERWENGDMKFWLEDHLGKVVTLWTSPECAAAFDPFPLLVPVLVKCGAEHLGEWQVSQQRGAA